MLISNQDTDCSMILVMGVTVSGKSYFINQLANGSVVEGHGVRSGESYPAVLDDDLHTH